MSCIDLASVGNAEYMAKFVRNAGNAGIPLRATIELTERCNLRCAHCYLGDQDKLRSRRAQELSTEQWVNVIDQTAEMGCLFLLITGGDPLLRPDFAQIYVHAKRRGLLVTVFTNGTLLTETILDLFLDYPPFVLEISLYGVAESTYEAITRVPGSYRRCMAAIEKLEGRGLDLRLKTILMNQNQHEFEEITDYCREHSHAGKARFDFEIQGGFNGGPTPINFRLEPEDAVRIALSQPGEFEVWQDYYAKREAQTPIKSDRLYQCTAGRSMFHIGPYGQLQPCLTTRHISHDVARSSLAEALQAIRQRLTSMKESTDSPCVQCSERMVCNRCPAFSLLDGCKEEQVAGAFQCRVTRARSRQLLVDGSTVTTHAEVNANEKSSIV